MILKEKITSVGFLGSGNVATHLSLALRRNGVQILQIYSPNLEHAATLAGMTDSPATDRIADINPDADLYLISVTDDKIKDVVNELKPGSGIVAHTSGIVKMDTLEKFENNTSARLAGCPRCS